MFLIAKTFLSGFISKNWKWLVPLILAGLAIIFMNILVRNIKSEAFKLGEQTERTAWTKKQAETEAKNREFEGVLRSIVVEFGEKAVRTTAARVAKETKYREKIETIIREKPIYQQCKADQSVIDSRNAIRAVEPKNGASVRLEL